VNWMTMYETMDHIARETLLKRQHDEPEVPKCIECGEPAEPEWELKDGIFMCPECFEASQ